MEFYSNIEKKKIVKLLSTQKKRTPLQCEIEEKEFIYN